MYKQSNANSGGVGFHTQKIFRFGKSVSDTHQTDCNVQRVVREHISWSTTKFIPTGIYLLFFFDI